MDEIDIIEFVVDQVGAIHSPHPSQSTRVSGGGWRSPRWPDVEISSDSFFFTRRGLVVRSWSARLCDAPAARWTDPSASSPWSCTSSQSSFNKETRKYQLEDPYLALTQLESASTYSWLLAPVGILKPLRKSVLERSQEPRSRDQRGCTWLATMRYPHRSVQHQTRAVTHVRHKPLTDVARFPWKIRTSPGQTDGKQWNNDHRNAHSTDKFTTFVRVPCAAGDQTPWLHRLTDSLPNPSPPSIIKSLLIRSISCQ